MEKRILSVFLFVFSVVFPLLHASSGNLIVNGTRGSSLFWLCHHTFNEPFQPDKCSIFWQGYKGSDIVLHVYKNGQEEFHHQHESFQNRTTIFLDQLPLGNFSLIIEKLMLQDDEIAVKVIFISEGKPAKKLCQTTLYVAAPFQEPKIEINQAENTATCSTKGGYPKPELKWTSEDGRILKLRKLPVIKKENDGTYSVISTVNITGLNNVTCEIYNPTSKETLRMSHKEPVTPPATGTIISISIIIIIIIIIMTIIFFAVVITLKARCPLPWNVPAQRTQTTGGASAEREAPCAAPGQNESYNGVSPRENQAAYRRQNSVTNDSIAANHD
ncbi:hypothetical protein Q5P01_013142 [Channa striata]|uniref:Ig-like domain-containing protein n=1 Tax=Channa striata TaxID=64152 RepID=A0AA88MIU8_CHASR|nr:hypothetical protein Q5P01_013142 [Channa striata]